MAREVVKRKPKAKRFEDSFSETPQTATKEVKDVQSAMEHIRSNALMYAGGVIFVALAILAGILFRVATTAAEQDAAAAYARALDAEDPAMRASALAKLPTDGPLGAEITYMIGESAYEAGNHDRAREAFEKVRSEYPDSRFVAEAIEGLGYIAEDAGEFEKALAFYQEAGEMEGTFAARRQPYNIGRVQEKLGNLEAAVAAYEQQPIRFPESMIAANAEAALDRLRQSHPDLFPEATPVADSATPAETAAPADADTASDADTPAPDIDEAVEGEASSPAPEGTDESAPPTGNSQGADTPAEQEASEPESAESAEESPANPQQ